MKVGLWTLAWRFVKRVANYYFGPPKIFSNGTRVVRIGKFGRRRTWDSWESYLKEMVVK